MSLLLFSCINSGVLQNELCNPTYVVFVLSTTGQGEFPRNARKFWKGLLRKKLPPTCLSSLTFTTVGLGDSSYAQYRLEWLAYQVIDRVSRYNIAARKLHKRLEQLGAVEFYPRGEADEQHSNG